MLTPELPSLSHKDSFIKYAQDYQVEKSFYSEYYKPALADFEKYCTSLIDHIKNGILIGGELIPVETFWFFDANNEIVGAGRIRYKLNEQLINTVGNIGFDIKPNMRGKGYGRLIMNSLLLQAKQKKLERVLLICDANNEPSRKIIEACGGKFQDEFLSEFSGELARRYWVEL